MDKIIVYVDDAEHALHQLTPMLVAGGRTEWTLVACPPHMTRHVSKWLSHTARENWRQRWCEKLWASLVPALESRGDRVVTMVAKGPLEAITRRLVEAQGPMRVLDARRPRLGQELPPVTGDQPASPQPRWVLPGSMATLGAMLILASE